MLGRIHRAIQASVVHSHELFKESSKTDDPTDYARVLSPTSQPGALEVGIGKPSTKDYAKNNDRSNLIRVEKGNFICP